MANNEPQLQYWIAYTDDEGVSRQEQRTLEGFTSESMGGDSGNQWNNRLFKGATQIIFSELPADFDGDWHENPHPQWIIPISGGWWVETMDGQRVELREGDLAFGADQGTTDGKGHRSGVLDGKPCQMMIVQYTNEPRLLGGKVTPDQL